MTRQLANLCNICIRITTTEQLEGDDTDAPDVYLVCVALILEYFWSHVHWCA